ncbi:MAG: ATP-dependent DNA helicase RecQ [Bacteroidota bacterium]
MNPLECLKKYWGHEAFRPLQSDIINHVLDHHQTLALLPTGGGKSICFQIPGLLFEGLTIVISPLIALMKDQVDQLNKRGIPSSAVYSGMDEASVIRAFDGAREGKIRFLYLSPERLRTRLFRQRITEIKVSLVAIDEAHCISQWGYDFRPEYLQISDFTDSLKDVHVIALTATATPEVVNDMVRHLRFKQYRLFQSSFKRENLFYHVLPEDNKTERLLRICKRLSGTGIVYVRNRRKTTEISLWLQKQGISAEPYHAGMLPALRDEAQQRWMLGKTRVMVCTNAFGMGIDKPDCRFVVHLDVPDGIESYFQEAGRAGRDGKTAHAVFLFDEADIKEARIFLAERFPESEEIRNIYTALCNHLQIPNGSGAEQAFSFSMEDFCRYFSLKPARVFAALQILDRQGILRFDPDAWTPSRLKIKLDAESLYSFGMINRKWEPMLKALLRSYPGIFNESKVIQEFDLARMLNLPKAAFIKSLLHLHKLDILEYVPSGGASSIVLLQPRMDKRVASFQETAYKMRVKTAEKRLNAIIEYISQNNICRSVNLLSYFGENHSSECGQCDVCRRKTEGLMKRKEFDEISGALFSLLEKSSKSLNELLQQIPVHGDKKVMDVVRYWMDHGVITGNPEGLILSRPADLSHQIDTPLA